MTHAEYVAALERFDRRVYLLALVEQIWESCVENCDDDSGLAVIWALDATRRWCLGLADEVEVRAAAYAASAAASAASSAAYAASFAASAASYAAYDASYAAWLREGHLGGRWILRSALTPAQAVQFDRELEAA